jgi:hypothetical protein
MKSWKEEEQSFKEQKTFLIKLNGLWFLTLMSESSLKSGHGLRDAADFIFTVRMDGPEDSLVLRCSIVKHWGQPVENSAPEIDQVLIKAGRGQVPLLENLRISALDRMLANRDYLIPYRMFDSALSFNMQRAIDLHRRFFGYPSKPKIFAGSLEAAEVTVPRYKALPHSQSVFFVPDEESFLQLVKEHEVKNADSNFSYPIVFELDPHSKTGIGHNPDEYLDMLAAGERTLMRMITKYEIQSERQNG